MKKDLYSSKVSSGNNDKPSSSCPKSFFEGIDMLYSELNAYNLMNFFVLTISDDHLLLLLSIPELKTMAGSFLCSTHLH